MREDIVCDVFARLWLKGEDFILKEETASADNFWAHQMNVPSYADSTEAIYTLDEMYALLYDAIDKLTETEKAVFHESFMMGKRQADIAKKSGVSTKTVERYRKKILNFLKNELKDNFPTFVWFDKRMSES